MSLGTLSPEDRMRMAELMRMPLIPEPGIPSKSLSGLVKDRWAEVRDRVIGEAGRLAQTHLRWQWREWVACAGALGLCFAIAGIVVTLKTYQTADSIRLQAQDQEGQLQIRWDPESGPIRRALDAQLFIVDGDQRIFVKLDSGRLRRGLVSYGRQSDRVDLRMALSEPDGKLVEEQTSFAGESAPRSPEPQLEALARPEPPAAGEPAPVAVDALRSSAPLRVATGSRARTRPLVETGTQLPFTCSTGDVFHKTDEAPGFDTFGCRGKNVWSLIGNQARDERSISKPSPNANTLTAKPATASTT